MPSIVLPRSCTQPIKATHIAYMACMTFLVLLWLGAHMPHCVVISAASAVIAHAIAIIVAYVNRLEDYSDSFHVDAVWFIATFVASIAGIGALWFGGMGFADNEHVLGGMLIFLGGVIVLLDAFFFLQHALHLVNED